MPSLAAIALRLLLCLGLILNGSGYAFAATQKQLTHVAMAQTHASHHAAAAADGMSASPCHSQDEAGAMAADHASHQASHQDPGKHGQAPDCCQSSQCVCDCLQHASLAIVGLPAPPSLAARAPSLHPLRAGHAAPTLANPIRPPIA